MKTCHWIENTSDTAAGIDLGGIGLLAETLLDALKENNPQVNTLVEDLRGATKRRKKEIAEERRSRALIGMNSFGHFAAAAGMESSSSEKLAAAVPNANNETASSAAHNNGTTSASASSTSASTSPRTQLSSMLNSSLAAFAAASTSRRGNTSNTTLSSISTRSSSNNHSASKSSSLRNNESNNNNNNALKESHKPVQPSWLAEMEAMEDEEGLTCAVCHEGVTFKPTELLGLYSFVKKVSIPQNKGGAKTSIDGTHLFLSLPSALPDILQGTHIEKALFRPAKTAAKQLNSGSLSSSSSSGSSSSSAHAASLMASSSLLSSRPSNFITTVTAGTAIHCTCHSRARQADRNHPKAPKSEWEGASLRNSRVTCNVILPLVTSHSSEVPLVAVESGLAEYQAILANTMGGRPKSMLWTVLHDVRLLLLRISYGESLSADCGGGSLASNVSLVFYLLSMAYMFSKHAEHGNTPSTVQHAKCLSLAFCAASEIIRVKDSSSFSIMHRPLADAAPMAGICAIIFDSNVEDGHENDLEMTEPESSKQEKHKNKQQRQWSCYKHHFLNGLIRCAGRRKACGIEDSGCVSGGRSSAGKRVRSSSFAEWEVVDSCDDESGEEQPSPSNSSSRTNNNTNNNNNNSNNKLKGGGAAGTGESLSSSSSSTLNIEDHAVALRPMITLYVILDMISADFEPNMDDEKVTASADKLTQKIGTCQHSKNIKELIQEAGITLENNEIMAEYKKGLKPF